MKNIISLGAGVQSSTMALMAAKGEITPMPDGAIFADTQAEPKSVYDWLDWLEKQLPFPVYRVTAGSLEDETFRVRISKKNGKPYGKNYIPSFGLEPNGDKTMLPRKCTYDFKLVPIHRKLRELAQPKRGDKRALVKSLIGISFDEAHRMKPALFPWIENVYPLVDRRITRHKCLVWMNEHGYPTPPRSACVFCPYHSNAEWDRLKKEEPWDFARAVLFEKNLQASAKDRNVTTTEFLHASRQPLDEVQFSDPNQMQLFKGAAGGFGNECEGMCGV